MTLPKVALATSTVEIEGEFLEVRALSRAEMMRVQVLADKKDLKGAEVFILTCALQEEPQAIRDWYEEAPNVVIDKLLREVRRISRLEDPKSEPEGDDAG